MKENFSYFSNRDHFGLQAIINQIRTEQSLEPRKPPPGFYNHHQPVYHHRQRVYYHRQPLYHHQQVHHREQVHHHRQPLYQQYGFYTMFPPPPKQPILTELDVLQQVAHLQNTDLNNKANPWVNSKSNGSFFDFKDCDNLPLENK